MKLLYIKHTIFLHCAITTYMIAHILYLLVPPTFVKKVENVSTIVGDVAVFHCVVDGSLPIDVQWQKDENWISQDPKTERRFENKEATLRIPVCEAIHGGNYSCQVVNEAGQDKCFATLVVEGTCPSCMSISLALYQLQQQQ